MTHHRQKQILGRFIGVLSLFWALAGWAVPSTAKDSAADDPHSVLVATILETPPYVEENPSAGIDLDIIRAVFANVGRAVDFVHAPLSRVEFLLSEGRVDAMTTFRANPDNCVNSDVFSYWHDGVSVHPALADQVASVDDLAGLRVGMFPGAERVLAALIGDYISAFGKTVTIFRTPLAVRLLRNGRIDAYIGDVWGLEHAARRDKQYDGTFPFITKVHFPPTARHLCFRDDMLRRAFDKGLRQVRANRLIEKIQNQYRRVGDS